MLTLGLDPSVPEGASLLDSFLCLIRGAGLDVNEGQIAREVFGVSPAAFSAWKKGKRPEAHHRAILEAWSGGRVPARSWFSREESVQIEKARLLAPLGVAA